MHFLYSINGSEPKPNLIPLEGKREIFKIALGLKPPPPKLYLGVGFTDILTYRSQLYSDMTLETFNDPAGANTIGVTPANATLNKIRRSDRVYDAFRKKFYRLYRIGTVIETPFLAPNGIPNTKRPEISWNLKATGDFPSTAQPVMTTSKDFSDHNVNTTRVYSDRITFWELNASQVPAGDPNIEWRLAAWGQLNLITSVPQNHLAFFITDDPDRYGTNGTVYSIFPYSFDDSGIGAEPNPNPLEVEVIVEFSEYV